VDIVVGNVLRERGVVPFGFLQTNQYDHTDGGAGLEAITNP